MDEGRLLSLLRQSGKYGALDDALLRRVAGMMSPRYKKEKDALDAAKRHLHVICGMYQEPGELSKLGALLQNALRHPPTPELVRETAMSALSLHASTRERLPHMEACYAAVFGRLSDVHSVLDVGCGLHPFARPFMAIQPESRYIAYDVRPDAAAYIQAFFDWAGYAGEAGVLDLMAELPQQPCDLAFLLKLLPVLEQQQKGRAEALLSALSARYAAVTFPTRSMGGKKQGMAGFYAQWMRQRLAGWEVLLEEEIGNELLFLIKREEA